MHLFRSLRQSNKDIRLLWLSSFLRMLSYGLTNQVLTLYLVTLNVTESQIGVFMTLTLVGDTALSYILTWYADRIGRRAVMATGSALMFISGVIFATSSNFSILLLAAIFGVISPSGDETGPFKSIEEASIAHLTPLNHRPEIYAFHGMFSTFGAALGSITCGFIVDTLNQSLGWDIESTYRSIFWIYSAIALEKFLIMLLLSAKCEIGYKSLFSSEDSPLIPGDEETETGSANNEIANFNTYSGLSPHTQKIMINLLVVFMLDSLGYGFMPAAWVVYYFKTIFKVSATILGTLFFITNIFTSASSLPSAYLSKKFGPVKSILIGQIPSGIFFIIVGLTSNYIIASIFLILNAATSSFDVVPRQVLLTSIIERHDLTKVLGVVNICKTLARCVGPVFTGKLASADKLYFGYYISGVCVLVADAILYFSFGGIDEKLLKDQSIDHDIE